MRMHLIVATYLISLSVTAFSADYAAWSRAKSNTDGKWTSWAEMAVNSTKLPNIVPADIFDYCKNYQFLSKEDKGRFWVGLLSIMAKRESDNDPTSKFEESFPDRYGNNVVSKGLLQISEESANGKSYACNVAPDQLFLPKDNIECAAKILSYQVDKSQVISGKDKDGRNIGGAAYWSVLRMGNDSLVEIKKFTNSLEFCRVSNARVDAPSDSTSNIFIGMEKPRDKLSEVGFLDIGAGYASIPRAAKSGKDATGFVVSIRAYPFGKWYAPLKSATPKEVAETAKALSDVSADATKASKATADFADKVQEWLNGNESKQLYAVEEGAVKHLLRRASIFYGRSVGGFDSDVIEGDLNAIGIGYDITPEFSILVGRANYKEKLESGGIETQTKNIYGINLNLSAFKLFRDFAK